MHRPDTTARVLIFAKAPVPGQVKTRLIPALGAEGAARLHQRLLQETAGRLAPAGVPIDLLCAPDSSHPVFGALAAAHGLRLQVQQGADLGERMARAVRTVLDVGAGTPWASTAKRGGTAPGAVGAETGAAGVLGRRAGGATVTDRVLLVGCDCPGLDASYLTKALRALDDADAVLGPAADGGYVLLGLRHLDDALFQDMPWGTARVAELTRDRLRALGRRRQELPILRDLDRPEDLDLLV